MFLALSCPACWDKIPTFIASFLIKSSLIQHWTNLQLKILLLLKVHILCNSPFSPFHQSLMIILHILPIIPTILQATTVLLNSVILDAIFYAHLLYHGKKIFKNKIVIITTRGTEALLHCDQLEPGYQPQHFCMNSPIHYRYPSLHSSWKSRIMMHGFLNHLGNS